MSTTDQSSVNQSQDGQESESALSSSSSSSIPTSNLDHDSESKQKPETDPEPEPTESSSSPSPTTTTTTSSAPPPVPSKPRPPRKRRVSSQPKGILKPSPVPQKAFSFRRDILQSLNTRLAQQGVNVQIPINNNPSSTSANAGLATSNVIQAAGGLFRRIGGIAAGVVAPLDDQQMTAADGRDRDRENGGKDGGDRDRVSSIRNDSDPNPSSDSNSLTTNRQDSKSTSSTTTSEDLVKNPTHSAAPLKRVQFTITSMAVTYPISNGIAPSDEDFTRIRIEREHRLKLKEWESKKWNVNELESLYRNLCRIREEMPLKKMRTVFSEASQSNPPILRTMDLSFVPLDRHAIEPIADFLSVNFGLGKLVLENCNLVDETLKPLLHALLISGSLPTLSLASNRKIKFNGWRYIAIFMRRARALRYLDLSENTINKAALEQLVQAITKDERPISTPTPTSKTSEENTQTTPSTLNTSTNDPASQNKEPTPSKSNGKARQLDEDDTSISISNPTATQTSSTIDSLKPSTSTSEEHFDDFDNEALMPSAPLLRSVSNSESPPSSAIISLRLENCGLKTNSLDLLAHGVRTSDLRHLSLRRNRIGQMGAVALAGMLKDYPDSRNENGAAINGNQNGNGFGVGINGSSRLNSQSDQTPASATFASRSSTLPIHPNHKPSIASAPATRTRYNTDEYPNSSPTIPDLPVITSSPAGGITSRRLPTLVSDDPERGSHLEASNENGRQSPALVSPLQELDRQLTPSEREQIKAEAPSRMTEEEAISMYQAKRTKRLLKDLPRIGNLLTLDLKSNDIRGGVIYLSQVLKKNRTLRVLNLSDNNIEMNGLIHLAEALKINSTLETLDISHNPCAGPGLEGITRLRTAFTLNSNLKRLFLNDTDLSSEGAIALAEFLPEAKSLIHLDLTENFGIDIAGVMALAVSVKMNQSLRCLDLNIPANDPDFARLSQDILQSCVRNTEQAQRKALQRGSKQAIAAPIYKSVVARAAKEKDERQRAVQAAKAAEESALKARREGRAQDAKELVKEAEECNQVLMDLVRGEEERRKEKLQELKEDNKEKESKRKSTDEDGKPDFVDDLVNQAKKLRERLVNAVGGMQEGEVLDRALTLNDSLESISSQLSNLYISPPTIDTTSLEAAANQPSEEIEAQLPRAENPESQSPGHLSTPVIESSLSSPTFSIGSEEDDDEDDDEESENQSRSLQDQVGLGILPSSASDSIEIQAAREEVPLVGETPAGKEETENETKAKGQLSEEAELFRKAKSLGLDEEEDDEEGDEDNSKSLDGVAQSPSTSISESLEGEERQEASNTSSTTSGTDEKNILDVSSSSSKRSHSPNSSVSGEELRKDLLQTELPTSSSSSSSPESKED